MKKMIFLFYFIFQALDFFAHSNGTAITIGKSGIGLGSAIAVTISWDKNKSILWAIIHGILSWFYVIYFYLNRNKYDMEK